LSTFVELHKGNTSNLNEKHKTKELRTESDCCAARGNKTRALYKVREKVLECKSVLNIPIPSLVLYKRKYIYISSSVNLKLESITSWLLGQLENAFK